MYVIDFGAQFLSTKFRDPGAAFMMCPLHHFSQNLLDHSAESMSDSLRTAVRAQGAILKPIQRQSSDAA